MNKESIYKELVLQASGIITTKENILSNMANLCALVHRAFNHHWTGFYLCNDQEKYLYLGPFQGPVACTRIDFDKGVCGNAWKQEETVIVDNVHEYPGHIACSAQSNSEIVIPLIIDRKVFAVLDIDSTEFNMFDETDRLYLERLTNLLTLSQF